MTRLRGDAVASGGDCGLTVLAFVTACAIAKPKLPTSPVPARESRLGSHEAHAHEAQAHEAQAHEAQAHEAQAHDAQAHDAQAHEVDEGLCQE